MCKLSSKNFPHAQSLRQLLNKELKFFIIACKNAETERKFEQKNLEHCRTMTGRCTWSFPRGHDTKNFGNRKALTKKYVFKHM